MQEIKHHKRLCERIGMRKEAHFIQDFWNKGEWTDSIVYGMLLSDLKITKNNRRYQRLRHTYNQTLS